MTDKKKKKQEIVLDEGAREGCKEKRRKKKEGYKGWMKEARKRGIEKNEETTKWKRRKEKNK